MELREYQKDIASKGFGILKKYGLLYLSMEVRTGKTLTALSIAQLINARNVLCITRKKAIESIRRDYASTGYNFRFTVTNYEQADKLLPEYDLLIIDEAHSLGAFPVPSLRTKNIKALAGSNPVIYLSGTPTPESYSQIYHQFWISDNSPFKEFKNFYKWVNAGFVEVKQKMINGYRVNNYAKADKEKIDKFTRHLFINFSQKEAGFTAEIDEEIKEIDINENIYKLTKKLEQEKYFRFKDETEIVCDTAAKLLTKIHQLCSGTVITEDGTLKVLDQSKAEYIKKQYSGKKIAIFYKYRAEEKLLKEMFPNWTESPEEFNAGNDRIFLSQVQSGSMGVNLSTADCIIFYNIDYSSLLYWQARARSQSLTRSENSKIHWLFSKFGIEKEIYKAVIKKKDFTTSYFRRIYDIR